jgi:cbb3-type cytochrome oxidase maturation protein
MIYMDEAVVALTVTSLTVFITFISLLIWGIKSGQFRDIEEPKYRMLENDEDECRKER